MKKNIKHFLCFTAVAAGTIHFINRFIDNTAEMKHMLNTDHGEFYTAKTGKIYYQKHGKGSPILLIHDLSPIASSYEWCRFAKKLEKQHTVYTIDLLGCGRSEKPYLTYTNYLYVQLITDFIHDIIGESPDIIVSHNSASFVIQAAGMDSNLIKSITAINPVSLETLPVKSDPFIKIKKILLEFPVIGTFLYNIETIESNIEKTLRRTYFHNPQLVSTKMLDTYYESSHKESSHGKYLMSSLKCGFLDHAIEYSLKNMETPLYIIGSIEHSSDIRTMESYRKVNSKIKVAYLPNAGAIPQLEMPEKILELMQTF